MTPEAGHFLDKARKLLAEAETMLGVHLYDAAGRTAYLAGFHSAQAFISEQAGKSVKTHRGVHVELHRLTKDDPSFDGMLRTFLSQSCNLNAIADYMTGPGALITAERAAAAVHQARGSSNTLRPLYWAHWLDFADRNVMLMPHARSAHRLRPGSPRLRSRQHVMLL